jgi:hypothetical protein
MRPNGKPRYSLEVNPIEEAFAILKGQRIVSGKSMDELRNLMWTASG